MKRLRPLPIWLVLMPLFLTTGISVANAQPPGDPFDGGPLFDDGPGGRPQGGGDGRGPRGGPRGGGAKGRLDGFMHGVERLEGKSNDLSKAQAQKIVALIKPWSTKSAMSDADAQKLAVSLEAVLTSAQKSNFGPPGRGGRGPSGPGRGGNDWNGPPDGDFGGPPPGGDFGGPPDGGDGPPPPPDGDFGPPPGEDDRDGNGPRGMGQGRRMALPASFNPFFAPTGRSDWKKLPATTQQLLARRYRENRAVIERLSRRPKK